MYNLELWKQRKKELKLTLDDIAKATGIGISTIKDIFRGATYAPRIDTVEAIEKALGLNDDFFTTEDYANGVRYTKQVNITADDEDILDKYHEVEKLFGEKGKNLIIEFCDFILDKF